MIRRPMRLVRSVKRYAAAVARLVFPRYTALPRRGQIDYEFLRQGLTEFDLQATRFVMPPDFLPDGQTFVGLPFQDSPHVDFARRLLVEGAGFDFTRATYFRLAKRGLLNFPCRGSRNAALRVQDFIYLIRRIESDGYQPKKYGPISVVPCVDGCYAVVNGKHRLAALLALGVRHAQLAVAFDNEVREILSPWQRRAMPRRFYSRNIRLTDQLGQLSSQQERVSRLIARIKAADMETWADIYHPIPFHEFRKLSTQVAPDTPYRRLALILRYAGDVSGKRVLDLGCNLGFYAFSLARRGADVTGIEIRADYAAIVGELIDIYGVPFEFINDDVSAGLLEKLGNFDITLCFSMLQWVIDQHGLEYGMAVLEAISERTRTLFFDISVNSGKACLKCPVGQEVAYVDHLLRSHTRFTRVEYVGRVYPYGEDVRHVFLCER